MVRQQGEEIQAAVPPLLLLPGLSTPPSYNTPFNPTFHYLVLREVCCQDGSSVGGYAESASDDFFGRWVYNYSLAGYSLKDIPFADGSTATFHQRERPKVLAIAAALDFICSTSPPHTHTHCGRRSNRPGEIGCQQSEHASG